MSTTTSLLPRIVADTLPVEVEERIIDKLHYHIDALQKCTLTCHRWLPRARYHLFAAIRVTTKDELFSFYALSIVSISPSTSTCALPHKPPPARRPAGGVSIPDGAGPSLDITFELSLLEV